MKTISFTKLIPALVLGIFLAGSAQARTDNYSRFTDREGIRKAHTVKLKAEDIRDIQKLLSLTDAIEVSWNRDQLRIRDGNNELSLPVIFEARREPSVEDWMFEPAYLSEEPAVEVESWMTDGEYLETESQPLEGWMFDADRYAGPESDPSVESWMLDATYLSR